MINPSAYEDWKGMNSKINHTYLQLRQSEKSHSLYIRFEWVEDHFLCVVLSHLRRETFFDQMILIIIHEEHYIIITLFLSDKKEYVSNLVFFF